MMNQDTPTPSTPSRTRRIYSTQFKSELVASCQLPGASVSAIAAAHGMNANVLRRWLQKHRQHGSHVPHVPSTPPASAQTSSAGFIALDLSALQAAPACCTAQTIDLRCQRGDTLVSVAWPLSGAAECASLLLQVLR
ncbi:transposase [Limnohabitans sp. 2KL-3]|jgi:transposase-like protein|uniref:transposase n=1 Tax=Limnohabitans sp. 2KL-3 TaxID=1100700 RepID=UPI000B7E5CC9|nr:transposase [Limnohabitans sp. 2KL-3]